MNEMDKDMLDEERTVAGFDSEERAAARREKYRQRRRTILLIRIIVTVISLLIIAIAAFAITSAMSGEPFGIGSIVSQAQKLFGAGRNAGQETGQADGAKEETDSGADTRETAARTEEQDREPGSAAAGEAGDAVVVVAGAPGTDARETADAANDAGPGEAAAGAPSDALAALATAAAQAAGYDYDTAIATLQAVPGYEKDPDIAAAIADYTAARDSCVAVDVTTVPHIFYHSLLNDTDRAFNVEVLGQFAVDGMNAWMTTIEEFDKITQMLYDAGYVYVRLRDLVVQTENADGSVHFEPNTALMLPPGKKAIVLSVDDLSYYHSYKAAGFPDKLVIDENGAVKCQYTDAAGNTTIGDYDVVPRLNTFIEQHPDASYRGARGLIAMTGYNGVFGYRTDQDYELQENLMEDQAAWLQEHPDFNRQTEIEEATKVAEAIKAEGWEFASHTWGHLSVTGASVERLQKDNERWVANVQNIVGPTDTIIFAHGNDIGSWEGYSMDNPQYAYYKSAGYNFYCNVDGSVPYWVQISSDYVRQGRIDLDGYMLYQASIGATNVLDSMFNASEVFDQRRPTPVVANGQG